jgi:hypothetical protein
MNSKPMLFRRGAVTFVALLSISVIALAVLSPFSLEKIRASFADQEPQNSISGRTGGDGPVLVVKIDDTSAAHPQIGLEDADLIYIEQVEGGSTRLAAIYSSKIPTRVGPVRSARISDIELLEQYGRVGFAYSGAQRKMYPVIEAANLHDLGAQRNSPTIYTTDPNRISPFAMVLRADLLMELAASRNLDFAKSKNMGWKFGNAPESAEEVTSVEVSWPASSYSAVWSPSESRWLLNYRKAANIADSGQRLGASTFVIQLVSITDSIYKDKVGGVTPFTATVGSGRGYVLRDGKSIPALWSRPSPEDGTTWKTVDGDEIPFAKGQIWVALTDKEPVFTRKSADAANTGSK